MGRKPDVKLDGLGDWDRYRDKAPEEALAQIYNRVSVGSKRVRDWYWESIKVKRTASFLSRFASFSLLIAGATLPILAGILGVAETRLLFTQIGVAALAVAGLAQAGDRIFGISSGWLRYISTATGMENVTRKFEFDWADCLLNKEGALHRDDVRELFAMARKFEDDIAQLQSDETDKWVTEFNSSMALLTELIKSQRETSEQRAAEARTALAARTAEATPGSLEVELKHSADPVEVILSIDDAQEQPFTGSHWSKTGVTPGLHAVRLRTTGQSPRTIERVVKVPAGDIGKLEIAVP